MRSEHNLECGFGQFGLLFAFGVVDEVYRGFVLFNMEVDGG